MANPSATRSIRAVMLAITVLPAGTSAAGAADEPPRTAVDVARTTVVPNCTLFVDAAAGSGDGSRAKPFKTISAAVKAAPPAAVICVAEGTYTEEVAAGTKPFRLAGGFKRGSAFATRDSAAFPSKARGRGGSFLKIVDPGPSGDVLTAVDGFDISGYSQAILRDFYESQRFELTNNHIHGNRCKEGTQAGAAFALVNVSGLVAGNVIVDNRCDRGGGGFLNDTTNQNAVRLERNRVERNSGTEADAHGGGFYLFGKSLAIVGNHFAGNEVSKWGGGLYVGAYVDGGQPTSAKLAWNVYVGNKAGVSGGGFFCDDGAQCTSENELFVANCGGNVLLDGGTSTAPTVARFDHMTNVGAREVGCGAPGVGVQIDRADSTAPDAYSFRNSLFWDNGEGLDFRLVCDTACDRLKVSVQHTMMQPRYFKQGASIALGKGIIAPADPRFVDPARLDYRLAPDSPARGKGDPAGADLGAFGGGATPARAPAPGPSGIEPAARAQAPRAPAAAPAAVPAVVPATRAPAEAVAPPVAKPVAPTRGSADAAAARHAFEAARELDTVDGWKAFLTHFPDGFLADLARAHLKRLGS